MTRSLFIILALTPFLSRADDESEMMSVMRLNFEACNNEDVDNLMSTCSLDMPRREEFRRDCERLWKEKDIYYSLVSFQVLQINGDSAVVSVVQMTHTLDRTSPSGRDAFIRNGTGLLTEDECVEYKAEMRKDNGKWKCFLVISEPVKWDGNLPPKRQKRMQVP